MATNRSPDARLVYLHCSSIFSGANAQVRKIKKITQLLQKHEASIKILAREFSLPAIAIIAKELLENKIFESLPRAKLRYPELFQPSGTQEAERAASEAEVARIEAEAVQEVALASEDEDGDELFDVEQSDWRAQPQKIPDEKTKAPDNVQTSHLGSQSAPKAHGHLSVPKLHPVYLPFKTQHRILVPIQTLLEECCLEFGNTWVPELMEARNWHEAEAIELTEWTRRFLKHAKSLPPSAIKPIAGKSIAEVLFEIRSLRHSAVHRNLTSAAGIVNMLNAALTFAEALHDTKRAEKVAEIKSQLEASIEDIVQHQNLLERKLTDQLEDIARRRAELDELERLAIDETVTSDIEQRAEVSSTFESFLGVSLHAVNLCACKYIQGPNRPPKADSEAEEENIEESEIEYEDDEFLDGINKSPGSDTSLVNGQEKSHQNEDSEQDDRLHQPGNEANSVEEGGPEVSDLSPTPTRSKKEDERGWMRAIVSDDRDIAAASEAPAAPNDVPLLSKDPFHNPPTHPTNGSDNSAVEEAGAIEEHNNANGGEEDVSCSSPPSHDELYFTPSEGAVLLEDAGHGEEDSFAVEEDSAGMKDVDVSAVVLDATLPRPNPLSEALQMW